MKKLIPVFVVVVLVTTLFPISALAHGHRGGGTARQSYAVCAVEDCNTAYAHRHGSTWYNGHSVGDGHDYHEICGVSGCTLTTNHEHDGTICFPHYNGDGHGYHNSGYRNGGRHH